MEDSLSKKHPRDDMRQENICVGSGGSQPPCKCGTRNWKTLGLSKHLVCRNCVLCCSGPSVYNCDSILECDPEQWHENTEHYQCSTVVDEQDTCTNLTTF